MPFNNSVIEIEVTQPIGTGDNYYHVHFQGFYKGRIKKENGEWKSIDLHSMFTVEHLRVIGERIDLEG